MELGTISELALLSLLKEVKTTGRHWQSIIRDQHQVELNRKVNWFTNDNKATFYKLISLGRNGTFIDIGAGSGIISASLSKEYRRGYAIEYKRPFTEFMKYRFLQDDITNVEIIQGNAMAIPLKSNSINLAVVNGVLEWVANFSHEADPRRAQLMFLKEIRRCLVPEGRLGVAIENRWNYWYFRGVAAHGEASFVCVLPRWIANKVNIIVLKRPYREYIHNYWEYNRLFKEAGYKNIKIYLVCPSYYSPQDIYSMDKRSLNDYYDKYHSKNRVAVIVKRLSDFIGIPYLFSFFGPAFYIDAEK